jgi:ribosomal protein S1
MVVVNVLDVLDRLFPGYCSSERAAAWEVAKSRCAPGSEVEGIVVARFPFGVFVDIDVGFPALILVTRLRRRVDRQPYNSPERFPAIGSAVKARVCVWICSDRQISLTQLERDPMLGER